LDEVSNGIEGHILTAGGQEDSDEQGKDEDGSDKLAIWKTLSAVMIVSTAVATRLM
jgi:hypothetical protein